MRSRNILRLLGRVAGRNRSERENVWSRIASCQDPSTRCLLGSLTGLVSPIRRLYDVSFVEPGLRQDLRFGPSISVLEIRLLVRHCLNALKDEVLKTVESRDRATLDDPVIVRTLQGRLEGNFNLTEPGRES